MIVKTLLVTTTAVLFAAAPGGCHASPPSSGGRNVEHSAPPASAPANTLDKKSTGKDFHVVYLIYTTCTARNTDGSGTEIEVPYPFTFHITMTGTDPSGKKLITLDKVPFTKSIILSTSSSRGTLTYVLNYDAALIGTVVNAHADTGHIVAGPCQALLDVESPSGRRVTVSGPEFREVDENKIGSLTFDNTFTLPAA